MKTAKIREGEIIKKIAEEFFPKFDATELIGDIDFAVKIKRPKNTIDFADEYLLWAEAKADKDDIYKMLTQLVLTIGKARTFDKLNTAPAFLGCFDSDKIAFVPYFEIQNIFYQNDFNWNVTPSNTETKEFRQVYFQIKNLFDSEVPFEKYIFDFKADEKDLKRFIRENFIVGKSDITKLKIDKNNFIIIYNKWLETVKPTINVNWEIAKRNGLIDGDFYLADLLSSENQTIPEKLQVLLKSNHYVANRRFNEMGMFSSDTADFNDNQKAHNLFWAKYERPPLEDYWDYMIDRHDLLVPQDIRERKGSFYTPRIWVELSQRYLADVLGTDWQDEYYVWDCCAGSGNLLVGLTNKNNIWASTIDKSDVDVMKQRIERGANLWDRQVFQFDFLNDEFLPISKGGKLPDELFEILKDKKKRKKLLIYINPPYGEASNSKAIYGTGTTKSKVTTAHKTMRYKSLIGVATNEIFSHFLTRIYQEIPNSKLALFSKVKFICTKNYIRFRNFFKAEFKDGFVVSAETFDNVTGKFPIGFTIWNLNGKDFPETIKFFVPEKNTTKLFGNDYEKTINDWINTYNTKTDDKIGYLVVDTPDFQKVHEPFISLIQTSRHASFYNFNVANIVEYCIYLAVRHCISPTWLNDRDQFLYPNKKWEKDIEFQNDCLAFTLFHSQNRITIKDGVNHWIPFTETEINAKYKFESHFMSSFISGKIKQNGYTNLFEHVNETTCIKREFSAEAQAVFDAGREVWKYYHTQKNINPNASLYDIREYFQGRNDNGKMNNKSDDETYNQFIDNLRLALKYLAAKIEPKVYEYGFLKE